MKRYTYPDETVLKDLLARPTGNLEALEKSVRKIMNTVKKNGDPALRKFTRVYDGVSVRQFAVSEKEILAAEKKLDPALREAIRKSASNIRRFHEGQLHVEQPVETIPGVQCWRKSIPIQSVGLYIPGGTAPLFSTVLMLGIPASLAVCPEIVLCSPPNKEGTLHPAMLFAAKLAGIQRIYRVGGVQAIAAMAYGTDSIPKVHKIFGPGNSYVTMAKQLAQLEGVAIDMPAGPSEVCVIADATANPAFVAADLLSQAEHGKDSQVLLISDDAAMIERVLEQLKEQVALLHRFDIAESALGHSKAILARDLDDCMRIANAYAPEHLILACADAERFAEKVTDAGSVFIGQFTPESAGDYASGTNHTLPTNGHARAYSGVSVDSFFRKVTFQQITPDGLRLLGPVIIAMAEAEGLQAHAEAVKIRLT